MSRFVLQWRHNEEAQGLLMEQKGPEMATKTRTKKITPEASLLAAQIQSVRDYASYRCTNGRPPKGWDIVLETWSDDDIVAAIGKARSTLGAVNKVAAQVAMLHVSRDDIQSA